MGLFLAIKYIDSYFIVITKDYGNESDTYPWGLFLFFGIVAVANCYAGFQLCEDIGDVKEQMFSGGTIFIAVFILMLYLVKKQSTDNVIRRKKYYITISGNEDFEMDKEQLKKLSMHYKDIEVNKFDCVEELLQYESIYTDYKA